MAEKRKKGTAKERSAPTRGTAPSSPDMDKLEKFEASPEAQAAVPSDVDAMGKDKRREVIGQAYGPSRRSQFAVLGGVLAVFAVIIIGFSLIAGKADETPKSNPDKAPWSRADAPQREPVRPQ